MRANYEHRIYAEVDSDKLILAFPKEREEFDGDDREFVIESAQVMGRDFFDGEWISGFDDESEIWID